MPIYHYKCSNCPEDFETFHSIKEPIRKVCPSCNSESLSVVLDGVPDIMNKGEIKTVGQLAEANAKKMGKEQLHKKMSDDGIFKRIKDQEKMAEVRKIASLSEEGKLRYIETGKL
jgi:putative FmdB family regulatory protein